MGSSIAKNDSRQVERKGPDWNDLVAKHLSNEKSSGWLGYIGDYTTQLYGDYNKPL